MKRLILEFSGYLEVNENSKFFVLGQFASPAALANSDRTIEAFLL